MFLADAMEAVLGGTLVNRAVVGRVDRATNQTGQISNTLICTRCNSKFKFGSHKPDD